jgi:hypothetical protein
MSISRTFLAVMLLAPTAAAAELVTLEGKKITGDIVAISGNELTFKSSAGEEKFLVTTLSAVTTGPAPKFDASKKHTTVELIDGSLFRCSEITIRGKTVEAKLLTSPPKTVNIPMRPAVFAINREVGDLRLEQDFRKLVLERVRRDRWVYKRPAKNEKNEDIEVLDAVEGTFGDGDQMAETVKFTFPQDGPAPRKDIKDKQPKDQSIRMSRVAGMILVQQLEKPLPPALCKVLDTEGNELVVSAIERNGKSYKLTSVVGVAIDLPEEKVSKFDFAAGAVRYLSDLEPVHLELSGSNPEQYQKDKNLDKRPIRLLTDPAMGKSEIFPKGLTLKAKTVITYELKGQYKAFRAVIGVDADPENVASSHVKLTIDDGMAVLWQGKVKRGDKPVDLNISVQNVDRLKITVESEGSLTDEGNHVTLANARVLK